MVILLSNVKGGINMFFSMIKKWTITAIDSFLTSSSPYSGRSGRELEHDLYFFNEEWKKAERELWDCNNPYEQQRIVDFMENLQSEINEIKYWIYMDQQDWEDLIYGRD
jgi:hypothetical protein